MWALNRRLACEDGGAVYYWHSADWFAELQQQINFGRDDAGRWVERCARRPLLFFDDLGQEAVISSRLDWAQSWLHRFIDIRVESGLPLFVTTNLTARGLVVAYSGAAGVRGEALIRRLLEMCNVIRFETGAERLARAKT